MLEDRNRTSHTYDEQLAKQVYGRLPNHLTLLEAIAAALPAEVTLDSTQASPQADE